MRFAPELPELYTEVTCAGYPKGGSTFCLTKGVVSRIDLTQSAAAPATLVLGRTAGP